MCLLTVHSRDVWGLKYFWRKGRLWYASRGNVGLQSSLRGVWAALCYGVNIQHKGSKVTAETKPRTDLFTVCKTGNASFVSLPFCPRVVVSKNLTVRSWMESTAAWAFFCHSSSSFLRLSTRRGPRRSVSREIWWGRIRMSNQVKRTTFASAQITKFSRRDRRSQIVTLNLHIHVISELAVNSNLSAVSFAYICLHSGDLTLIKVCWISF